MGKQKLKLFGFNKLNMNKEILGDFLEIAKEIDSDSVDLVFADPPFNISKKYTNFEDNLSRKDYITWTDKWLEECFRILKNTGSIYVMNIQENVWFIQKKLEELGMLFRNIIVWKNSSMPVKSRFCINYQPIIFFTKSSKYTFNYDAQKHYSDAVLPWGKKNNGNLMIDYWNDIPFLSGGCIAAKESILIEGTKRKAHVCQLPIALIKRMILFSTNENDIVLDPFAGSFTTAIAALETKRNYICVEKIDEYYDLGKKRINNYLTENKLF